MIPPFASRFLAGETPSAAIDHARDLNEKDIGALLNLLGEHYDDRTAVAADTRSYRSLIADIGEADIEACVSVKPTQLGLDISEDCFREHLDLVLEAASEHDVFVWVDMEDHSTTAATVEAFAENAEEHDMGICIQSNLRRTRDDLEGLADLPGKVRLVKGAYNPPGAVAFESKDRIDEEMERNLRFMFEEFEDGIALGSHDPELVTLAADLHAKHGTPYEIQMLMGVRSQAQEELAAHHDVWQYVPYGSKWPSYFYRRLTERTENIAFVLKALRPF